LRAKSRKEYFIGVIEKGFANNKYGFHYEKHGVFSELLDASQQHERRE
jgi:hypothetical protein